MNFLNWFETFLNEKELPFQTWDIETNGPFGTEFNIIDSDTVIELIKTTAPAQQAEIKDTIVKIDVMNGDVMDFFKHLAWCFCQSQADQMAAELA